MFSHKKRAERTAAQAWDYLSAAMAAAGESARAAGESAREAGKHTADVAGSTAAYLADRAGRQSTKLANRASKKSSKLTGTAAKKSTKLADKANSVGGEAWARANAAANALAGRKPGRPWGVIVAASLVGVALGWSAATSARAAIARQAENEEQELAETAVIVTPTYDNK